MANLEIILKQELLLQADHDGAAEATWRSLWRRDHEKGKEKSRSSFPPLLQYSMLSQSVCPDVCASSGSQSCRQKDRAPKGAKISLTSYIHH